jgi:hypothetical protein
MLDAEEENWREREESLDFAVLEALNVWWASSFCMKRGRKTINSEDGSYLSDGAEVTCLRDMHVL